MIQCTACLCSLPHKALKVPITHGSTQLWVYSAIHLTLKQPRLDCNCSDRVYLLKTKQLQGSPENKAPNLWQIYIAYSCSVGQRKIQLWLVPNSLFVSLFSYTTFLLIISTHSSSILLFPLISYYSPNLSDCSSHCVVSPVPPAPGVHLWSQAHALFEHYVKALQNWVSL